MSERRRYKQLTWNILFILQVISNSSNNHKLAQNYILHKWSQPESTEWTLYKHSIPFLMSPVIKDERERRSEFFPSLAPFKMVRYWNCQKYQTKIAFWIFYEELTRSDPGHSADYGPGSVGDDTSVLLDSECHKYSQADGNFKYNFLIHFCFSWCVTVST